MKIAVFSDSHDAMQNLKKGFALCAEAGVHYAFHLGDFCAPPALMLMAESGLHWRCVWGNNDGDKLLGYTAVQEAGTIDLVTTDFRELEVEGRKIFLTHYPEIGRIAALSGQYHAVFHGHNHKASQEMVGETLLANPGEVAGFRFGKPSIGLYDTEQNSFEHLAIV